MLSLSHSEGLVVWTTLELKQRQSKAVPEDIESLEMRTKSAEWQQKVISLGCGKQGQVRKAMDFTVWMNKRGLAGGKKWASWYVEFFHTQGSIAIKPFIIPPSSQSSVYLGPPVKMLPGGSVWPYRLEKRTCLFVYGVRAAEAHLPAWNTLSGLLWLWLGTHSSLQGQSSFMECCFLLRFTLEIGAAGTSSVIQISYGKGKV